MRASPFMVAGGGYGVSTSIGWIILQTHNPAQSGFDSSRNLLLAGYFTPPCTNKITALGGGYFIEQCG